LDPVLTYIDTLPYFSPANSSMHLACHFPIGRNPAKGLKKHKDVFPGPLLLLEVRHQRWHLSIIGQ
jgi:hypothetical protein